MRICAYLVSVGLVLSPLPAAAQHRDPMHNRPRLIVSEQAITKALTGAQPASTNRRDPLSNGAIVGAVIGAVLLGAYGVYLCHALDFGWEPDDDSWLGDAAIGAGFGAMVGAPAGAGIDALFAQGRGRSIAMKVPLKIK